MQWEKRTVELLLKGANNQEIANAEKIKLSAVKWRIGKLNKKYNTTSRAQLVALMLNAEAGERKQQEQTLLTLTTKLNSFLREAEVLAEARELALSKTHREIEFVENAFMRTLLRLNISPTSDIGTKLTRAFSLEMERKKP